MDYEVVERISFNKKRARQVGAFWYDPQRDGLYHESPWPFPVQLLIYDKLSRCQVTPMFQILPFIMKGWINLDILLRLIDVIHYVHKNVIMMHSSCVDNTLVVGFPNSGKTYKTMTSVAKGARFVSEEYTLIYENEGKWFAAPYKNPMRSCLSKSTMDAAGIKMTFKEKAWLASSSLRAKLFPFMYESVIWRYLDLDGRHSQIKEIVYGSSGRKVTNPREFMLLCENEFPFMANEFLQAYMIASGFDLIETQEKQRNLIKEFVNAVNSNPLC